MAQQRDLYDVLGVSREATQDEIKRAFRKLARENHPDLNQDPEAERRFKEINLAYETLSDPAKRRRYDMFGGEGFTPDMFSFGDLSGIFEAFFGGSSPFGRPGAQHRSRTARGSDHRLMLELTFEEAVFGTQKEIVVTRLERCERCGGKGAEPGTEPSTCSTCGGTGQVSNVRQSVFGTVMTSSQCATCRGTGEELTSPCHDCHGQGRLSSEQIMTVDVPAGVTHGMELRIEGAGDEGRGGPTGDLYLALHIPPHPVFQRRGQDLLCALDLPVSAAILGADVEVETLDGIRSIAVPPGAQPGSVIRVSGLGVPHLGRKGRGDLLVQIDVHLPERLGRRERPLIEEFAERRGEREQPLKGHLRQPES